VENKKSDSQNLNIDVGAIVKLVLKNWYLFGIVLFIALLSAFLFNKFAAPVFQVGSSVLFKKENNRSVEPSGFLEGFQLFREEKDFQNEIQVMQSTPLILEVIRNLNFNVSYFVKEDYLPKKFLFTIKEIYNSSPFVVIFDENKPQPVGTKFYVNLLNEEEFVISLNSEEVDIYDYRTERVLYTIPKLSLAERHKYGEEIKGNYFSFKVLLNSNYEKKEFEGKDLYFLFNNISNLTGQLKNSLLVEPINEDVTVARVLFEGPNIAKAIDFVNGLNNEYLQQNLDKKNYLAFSTIEYIDRQLENITDSLSYTEQELQNFRRNYEVMDISDKANRIYTQQQLLDNEKAELLTRLTLYQQMDSYFELNKDSSDLLAPSAMGIDDTNLNGLIQELTTFNSEKNTLIKNNQGRSPRIQALNIQIDNLKKTISENIKYIIHTSEVQLNDINNRLRQLQYEINRLPQTQRRLLGIERKFNLNNAIYTFLLEKRAEAQIAEASNLPDSDIIEPAQVITQVYPKKTRNYLLAFIAGVFFPALFLQIKKSLNRKITDKQELEKISPIPVAGRIIHNQEDSNVVFIKNPSAPISDSFRALKTNIDFYFQSEESTTILVTSGMAQDGKSFSALNLASVYARNNFKTALLGFDLRKPSSIYEEFNIENLVGLSSYLTNRAKLDDIIINTSIENLDIIQAGEIPPNPLELITSFKTGTLISELKHFYDILIIDSPPVGFLPDALLLMKYADLILFIVRHNFTYKKIIIDSLHELEQKKINNLFLVYNDERIDKMERKYGYYYSDLKH